MPCRPDHTAVSAAEMKICAHSQDMGLIRLSGDQGNVRVAGEQHGREFFKAGGWEQALGSRVSTVARQGKGTRKFRTGDIQ